MVEHICTITCYFVMNLNYVNTNNFININICTFRHNECWKKYYYLYIDLFVSLSQYYFQWEPITKNIMDCKNNYWRFKYFFKFRFQKKFIESLSTTIYYCFQRNRFLGIQLMILKRYSKTELVFMKRVYIFYINIHYTGCGTINEDVE